MLAPVWEGVAILGDDGVHGASSAQEGELRISLIWCNQVLDIGSVISQDVHQLSSHMGGDVNGTAQQGACQLAVARGQRGQPPHAVLRPRARALQLRTVFPRKSASVEHHVHQHAVTAQHVDRREHVLQHEHEMRWDVKRGVLECVVGRYQ